MLFSLLYLLFKGFTVIRFAPAQLHSIIQNEIGESDYQVHEVDFYGIGIKSYVLITDNIIILDKVQPNPIERILFSSDIYEKSFELNLDNVFFKSIQVLNFKNSREQLYFCTKLGCGFIQLDGGYKVKPSINNSLTGIHNNYSDCTQNLEYSSNIGSITLSKLNAENDGLTYFIDDIHIVAYPTALDLSYIGNSTRYNICLFDFEPKYGTYYQGCFLSKYEHFPLLGEKNNLRAINTIPDEIKTLDWSDFEECVNI